jgi:hypothetical protein
VHVGAHVCFREPQTHTAWRAKWSRCFDHKGHKADVRRTIEFIDVQAAGHKWPQLGGPDWPVHEQELPPTLVAGRHAHAAVCCSASLEFANSVHDELWRSTAQMDGGAERLVDKPRPCRPVSRPGTVIGCELSHALSYGPVAARAIPSTTRVASTASPTWPALFMPDTGHVCLRPERQARR